MSSYNDIYASAFHSNSAFQDVQFGGQVFTLTERSENGELKAYSSGNGRFFVGIPSHSSKVCFSLNKDRNSLDIEIHDDKLLRWLRTIPSLRNDFANGLSRISMRLLLPCYRELKAKFVKDKREKHSFGALDLFVRDFLREGAFFAPFGFERLHEEKILTALHFYDIQSQYRSISEDLDILDEAIDRLYERDMKKSGHNLMNESLSSKLRAVIKESDPIAVGKVLDTDPGVVDAKTLCLAIRYYEPTIFRLLLNHGAEVDGTNVLKEPLHHAAKAGHMDAVCLLLTHQANKEGNFSVSTTPLAAAASAGHFEIVKYLVEEKGANIDGNGCKSPLSGALKHHHTHIVDYLLRAGADVSRLIWLGHLEVLDILHGCDPNLHPTLLAKLLNLAATHGDLDVIRRLVHLGVDINPIDNESPLCLAANNGHLEVVWCLVKAGAKVNPDARHRGCYQQHYSPLAVAAMAGEAEVARFLAIMGATLLEGEDQLKTHLQWTLPWTSPITQPESGSISVGEFLENFKGSGWFKDNKCPTLCEQQGFGCENSVLGPEHSGFSNSQSRFYQYLLQRDPYTAAADVEDNPIVVDRVTQDRQNMVRRLFKKLERSREKLLDLGTRDGAQAGLKAFLAQIGTSLSVYRAGTSTIRDISEGYLPSSLLDIVSALLVADAMRSAVPRSKIICSEEAFLNDTPRWEEFLLLSPGDRPLFKRIRSYLWGDPTPTLCQEGTERSPCPDTLDLLQKLVKNVVTTSGLFENGSRNPCGSYRLQSLRQQYLPTKGGSPTCETVLPSDDYRSPPIPAMDGSSTRKTVLPLNDFHPPPTPEVKESLHTNIPKPPDLEGRVNVPLRVTILMSGAIFGAILFYLLLSQCGLSHPLPPVLVSDAGQGWASNRIMARNCIILAMYIGSECLVDSRSWKHIDQLLSNPTPPPVVLRDSLPTEPVQEHIIPAPQSSYEGDYTNSRCPSTIDLSIEAAPAGCSPSLPSHLTTSPSVTLISPSILSTATPGSITTGILEDGSIRCKVPSCKAKFMLGVKGTTGQASNLEKHMTTYHSENPVIYECKWGCGKTDRNKSNNTAHEDRHCKKRKREDPDGQGKRKDARVKTS